MKKEEFKPKLWFWRQLDGYFKKINNPCLVTSVSNNEIKIKMFNKLGETEKETFSKKEIDLLLKQARNCDRSEVKKYFNSQLIKLRQEKEKTQQKITRLEKVLSSV